MTESLHSLPTLLLVARGVAPLSLLRPFTLVVSKKKVSRKKTRDGMFKKPFKTQKQSLVKRSDLRKIRDSIAEAFPNLTETELNEVHQLIFFPITLLSFY